MPAHHKAEASVFAALGDDTRLALVERLRQGPSSIVGLSGDLGHARAMSRQAVTKHLQVLEKAGLVTCVRRGRTTVWQLERPTFDTARTYLDAISRHWDDALERLRRQVEA